MTFSLIVPVYNVEKYLSKCFDSILSQTYTDFELIVVNDGSPDNSQEIIDEYTKKFPDKIKAYRKENGGLSDARNFGTARAQGEYILFIDSDDYLSPVALKELKAKIDTDNPDVIGFNLVTVDEEGTQFDKLTRPNISAVSGEEAIIALVEYKKYFEPACGFAYRTQYWKDSGYQFMKGIYHEDFALVPLVILKAEKVSCIDLDAYYYVSSDNSITRTHTEERKLRLMNDLLKGYDFLVEEFYKYSVKNSYAGKLYLAYAVNAVIHRLESLDGKLKNQFRKEVNKRKVSKYIIDNTFKRKLRKVLIRLKNKI